MPLGRKIAKDWQPRTMNERSALRRRLELPLDKQIVISVAAINKAHKRIDYLIREVAALPGQRPYLVMLGQQESEAAELRSMAENLLGQGNFLMTSVPYNDVADYYDASDVFVMASVREGFGLVMVEAQARGLACLAHDYETARYVLGSEGSFADFTRPGSLTRLLDQVLTAPY